MAADSLQITLLDGFGVVVGADAVTIKGARSCQLLAYLALHHDTTVSADRLSDALWGEHPPASARNSIQRFVSDLRRDLGAARSRLISVGNGYRLELEASDWCDAVAMEAGLPLAREALADGRPGNALSLVDATSGTFLEPLASVQGAEFASLERVRLSELIAECGEIRAEAQLAEGDSAAAAVSARQLLDQYPYRERLCVVLATALTRAGRANEALEAIAGFRSQLRDDLGLDPSPIIERTELDVLLHRDTAPKVSNDRIAAPLTATATSGRVSLFGRDSEIAQATELLKTERMVTLTGTGGIGKTTVALAVIDAWEQHHAGETRFVSLEEITSQGLTASIGRVVGTSTNAGDDPLGEVVDRIAADVDVLVLDNCEHIADEVGAFVDAILEHGGDVRILATSRRPLGKVYERLVPLRPLDDEASRGFLRHSLGRLGIELSDLDSDSVAELLNELDGLPLAIELAGASLRSVGVRDLLSRWRSDEPAPVERRNRHLSIGNAIRSTLSELDADERSLLGVCAMFPGDFDATAIEALAGASVVDVLDRLEDHSLLEVSPAETTARYRMLVPIRSEIRTGSGPLDPHLSKVFVTHFQQLAAACLVKMKGTESLAGVSGLRRELNNIAAAFNFADDASDVSAMASIVNSVGLANGMSPSVGATSHLQEWGERLRAALDRDDPDDELTARVETAVAWGLYGSNDGAWYQRWETDSNTNNVETLAMAAIARFSCGQSAQAWTLLRDLDLTAASDPYMRAMLCGIGAVIAFEVGAIEADELTDATVIAANELPSHGASFFAGLARSTQSFVRGDPALATEILQSAAVAIDGHGLVTLENMGLASVAMTVGFILGERDPADLLVGILDRYLEQHSLDPASVAMALDVAVLRLDRAGRTDEAASLLGLLDRLGLSMAILRGARARTESRIDSDAGWSSTRAAGAHTTTFDVLRSARAALADVAEATRSAAITVRA